MLEKHWRYLLWTFLLSFPSIGFAQRQIPNTLVPSEYGETVFVSINDIYLLYLYPVTPYINDDGIIMVPLRALAETFLGFRIDIYEEEGVIIANAFTETNFLENGHFVRFFDNKPEAMIYDWSKIAYNRLSSSMSLTAKPIYLKETNEMLVPLDALLRAFDLESFWEPSLKTLNLKSNTVKTEPIVDNPRAVVWGLTRAFVPESVTFDSAPNNEWLLKLTIQGFESLAESEGPTPVWFTNTVDNPPHIYKYLILVGSGATKCPKQDDRFICELTYTREILETTDFIGVRFAP